MPDLTIEYHWHCHSAEQFGPVEVEGSKGTVHFVQFTKLGPRQMELQSCQYGWICTCKSFLFRGGKCKHIKQVEDLHCGWMQFTDGGEPEVDEDGERCCPNCGKPVVSMGWGV